MTGSGNRYLAEGLGTFILVLAGCGAIAAGSLYGVPDHLGISLVFGLVVMAVIYAIGDVSGAHINPAVSIAFCLSGRLPVKFLAPYIAAQCLGAVLACVVLRFLLGADASLGVTQPDLGLIRSLGMETVISFVLMFVILNVSTGHKEKGIMAGIAVGGTVGLLAAFAGPATGASMNPARSLGPALVSQDFSHLWLYLTAPVLGTAAAVPLCRRVQGPDCCQEPGHE